MARGSGSARRRKARVKAILAERDGLARRVLHGGDIIDQANMALRAVVALACEQRGDLNHLAGGDLAMLLGLIEEEFTFGRAVQADDAGVEAA